LISIFFYNNENLIDLVYNQDLTTAYTLLIEAGQLQEDQKVLIHGASGGVGSIMVQISKALGAYVIGTTQAPN